MSFTYDDPDKHFDALHLRSVIIITACGAMVFALLGWSWTTTISSIMKSMLTGAVVFAALSAFVAGNTFRLRDIRARRGNRARRATPEEKAVILASLPPRETIAMRFRLARIGAVLGVGALVLALFYSHFERLGVQVAATVSILGILVAALCFVGGTFARPLD